MAVECGDLFYLLKISDNTTDMHPTLESICTEIAFKRPPACYLGRLEMKMMKDEAEKQGYWTPPTHGEPDLARMEYCGVPLFQVDSESHIGFGQNETSPSVDATEMKS